MKLTELKRGEEAKIIKIGNLGALKKRFIELGITSGEKIKFERTAPLGDPCQYIIKNTAIAMRKQDVENIVIERI